MPNTWSRDWLLNYVEGSDDLPEGIEAVEFGADEASAIRGTARQVFEFFRRHDDSRYSSRSKMQILGLEHNPNDAQMMLLRTPFEFDEETETKRGGILAAAVILNGSSDNARLLLAVNNNHRRRKFGRLLMNIMPGIRGVTTWVHRTNRDAQQFLLSSGWLPYMMSHNGAIQFAGSPGAVNDDTVDGGGDGCGYYPYDEDDRF